MHLRYCRVLKIDNNGGDAGARYLFVTAKVVEQVSDLNKGVKQRQSSMCETVRSRFDLRNAIFYVKLIIFRFSVHRIILTATSRYFTANHGPNSQKMFILSDTDGEIIKMVVDFCYSGGIKLTTENIGNILGIASRLGLDFLEELCQQFLVAHLNASNCLDTLLVAESCKYSYLRQQAFGCICESFEFIPLTDIHVFDHELLQDVLKSDKLKATADVIYNRLVEWHSKSGSERNEHLHRMMNSIRLQHFPPLVKSIFYIFLVRSNATWKYSRELFYFTFIIS